jgi:hypothetical protein
MEYQEQKEASIHVQGRYQDGAAWYVYEQKEPNITILK